MNISKEEVIEAISKVKVGRHIGIDDIKLEIINSIGEEGIALLNV